MKKPNLSFLIVAGLLACATIVHGAYRLGQGATSKPRTVSALAVGDRFPTFQQWAAGADVRSAPALAPAEGCRIQVVFSPTCPHCHTARDREATSTQADRIPTTWLTLTNDDAAKKFAAEMRPGSDLRYSTEVSAALKIQAVPAAFLVDSGNRIRKLWVYKGSEDHQELRKLCAAV